MNVNITAVPVVCNLRGRGKPSALLECGSKSPYLPDFVLNTAIHNPAISNNAYCTSDNKQLRPASRSGKLFTGPGKGSPNVP